ncbi:MAG: YggT family protein [bacterium]
MVKEFILNFLNIFSNIFILLLFTRILLSFVPLKLLRFRLFVFNATEPVLAPVRKVIPPMGGVMDLSPIIVYLVLQALIIIAEYFL